MRSHDNLLRAVKASILAMSIALAGGQAVSAKSAAESVAHKQTKNIKLVSTQKEYNAAVKSAHPGDIIQLANGEWRDFEIVFTGQGTADQPITLTAQTPGKVILSGQSNLRIGGRHMVVSGLVFKDGYSPTGEVISFRRNKTDQASDSRVTNVVVDHFNQPDRFQSDYWVALYGKRNRFDHNSLVGKSNVGVTLAVRLDSEESRDNHHRIDHNYFGPRPVLGSNGGETIRIGTSTYSMFDSKTIVENNIFDRCDGEVEIVSIKSGANNIRGNLFLESRGSIVLRHGDGNIVERNVFLGNNKDHTGGIRVINRHQIVRGNYIEGSRGTGFASALTVMNGVPNSPVNRYVQVSDATIENNTIVASARITLAAGSDAERSAPPINSALTGNLLVFEGSGEAIEIQDDISGISLSGNIIVTPKPVAGMPATQREAVAMERAENGLLYPVDPALSAVGAPRDLTIVPMDSVGASFYAKPAHAEVFGNGHVRNVGDGGQALSDALAGAGQGDRLILTGSDYAIDRSFIIDKAISIEAADGVRPVITFSRSSLFELAEGGNLRLKGLDINGSEAPDVVGNAVIRTSATPILANFTLELDDVAISDLLVNKNFNVITFGKSAMADRLIIRNSAFSNITGTVIAADAETDDYGRYNAEYLTITGSRFDNVKGHIVALYRGGTDESTFGPHFLFEDNRIDQSGQGEGMPSVLLHGVQEAVISSNQFVKSGPIGIVQTTGVPVVRILDNQFQATPRPLTSRTRGDAPADVMMTGNSFDGKSQ